MAYSDKVVDHYNNPRNVGSFGKDTPGVGTGLVGAPECGDVMKLQIKVNLETGRHRGRQVQDLRLRQRHRLVEPGHEWLKGRTVDEAAKIKNTDIVNELKLPPVKIHCSVLAEDAIKAALQDYKEKWNGDAGLGRRILRSGRTDAHGAGTDGEGNKCRSRRSSRIRSSRMSSCAWASRAEAARACRTRSSSTPSSGPHDKKFDVDGVHGGVRRQELPLSQRHHARLRDGGAAGGFTFINPQAKSSCGCGTSFTA